MRALVVVLTVLAAVLVSPGTASAATQTPVLSWGLDRIDQADRPLSNSFTWTADGSGVRAYVLSTGVALAHSDFGGRATWGANSTPEPGTGDCDGQGTHLAGIVGGRSTGVAKNVRLVAVKVIPCTIAAQVSYVVAGLDWVRLNAVRPAVAVIGFELPPPNTTLSAAIQQVIDSGVSVVAGAGHANVNACTTGAGAVPAMVVAAATTNTDARSSWSNHGSCVDLFAPGHGITSTWIGGSTATQTVSGTPQSAAFAAGVMAQRLQTDPAATPAAVTSALVAAATPGVVTNAGLGSPNRLLRTVW